MTPVARWHLWLRRHNRLGALLIVALAASSIYLAQRRHWQHDFTRNARHTLSPASKKILGEMPGPIVVTAYATIRDERQGDLRQPIQDFVARYQYVKPDLVMKFVDPSLEPRLARDAGIRIDGELELSYRGRRVHITTLNERDFSDALMHLARRGEKTLMFLTGQGQRKLDSGAPQDLGEFARQLTNKGFRPAPLNLSAIADVPRNANVLILTQPGADISRGDVDKLKRYIARGGNLLWLVEPGALKGLRPLAEELNVNLTPGTVIDPAAREQGFPRAAAISSRYGAHPITADFDLVTIFPNARAIGLNDNSGWNAAPLVEAAPGGWLEDDSAGSRAALDPKHVASGPITIGVALEREGKDGAQREVVIGSVDFLSNAYVGRGGNLDFGINVVNWLAGDANLIAIQPRPTMDASLRLGRASATVLAVGFLLALPLAFFAAAVIALRRRNRG